MNQQIEMSPSRKDAIEHGPHGHRVPTIGAEKRRVAARRPLCIDEGLALSKITVDMDRQCGVVPPEGAT